MTAYDALQQEQWQIALDYQAGTDRGRQKRDGVVVTPVEVVDYIIRSAIDSLADRGATLTDPRVKITDPFGGTGVFLARLFQLSGLTGPALDDLVGRCEMIDIDPDACKIARENLGQVIRDLGGSAVPLIMTADTFMLDPVNLQRLAS